MNDRLWLGLPDVTAFDALAVPVCRLSVCQRHALPGRDHGAGVRRLQHASAVLIGGSAACVMQPGEALRDQKYSGSLLRLCRSGCEDRRKTLVVGFHRGL